VRNSQTLLNLSLKHFEATITNQKDRWRAFSYYHTLGSITIEG